MRVAHFCDSYAGRPDGVARSAGLTVALLREAGYEVDFWRPGPLLAARPEPGQVRSAVVPLRQIRIGLPFRGRPADLVHVHTTGPIGMRGFRLAARHRVPLVMTWHIDLLAYADLFPEIPLGAAWCAARLGLGWTPREFLELTRPGAVRHERLMVLGRAMFRRITVALAPSGKTAAGLAAFGGTAAIEVLPTPVARASQRARPGSGGRVLAVGRASAEKNPELLLRAFARVAAAKPDARLTMVGVRQNRGFLKRRIRALGLDGRVEVLPPVPHEQVDSYYRAADVLAFASTTDTQGLVVAEAEAVGLPVVLADPALAGPGRTAGAPEPDAFAAAILRMLDDPDERRRVIRDGLAAVDAYQPRDHLDRLIEIYRAARER